MARAWRHEQGRQQENDLVTAGLGDGEGGRHDQGCSKSSNQGNHTATHFARGHTHWCTLSLAVTAKSISESFMLWIKSKAILKYRVNDFSDFYFLFPPSTNQCNTLTHSSYCREGEKQHLLLLKVALTGQYPVITNPTNHNRLSLKDLKQIGDYYHLLGEFLYLFSFSCYRPPNSKS